jgi:hypothetical protein
MPLQTFWDQPSPAVVSVSAQTGKRVPAEELPGRIDESDVGKKRDTKRSSRLGRVHEPLHLRRAHKELVAFARNGTSTMMMR